MQQLWFSGLQMCATRSCVKDQEALIGGVCTSPKCLYDRVELLLQVDTDAWFTLATASIPKSAVLCNDSAW